MNRSTIIGIALLFFIIVPGVSAAKKAPGGFSSQELKSIGPLLRAGKVVGLAEVDESGNPKSMTLAIRVKAPRETVFKAIEDPNNYYYLSTLLKENTVLESHDNSKVWSWASRHKLFSFTGMNSISLYPPRRADVTFLKSNIGKGDFTFSLAEDGPSHTLVTLSGILDVDSSEWLIRFLIGGNPAMKEAMNMAIGLVVIKGVKFAAERINAGKPLVKHRTRGKGGGDMVLMSQADLKRLAPLLKRGQVIVTSSHGRGRLRQATVVDLVNAPGQKILDAISSPTNYAKMIKAISDVEVHSATGSEVIFSWTLGFSVFGITSRNRMTPIEKGVLLEGLDGDLAGAKWRWQLEPISDKQTVVAYHGFAEVAKAGYILEMTMKAEPYLEHGFMVGSNMVMLRAIRRSVEQKKPSPVAK